jgi:hypothetical protein
MAGYIDIFVSHKSEDRAEAERLVRCIEGLGCGYRCFADYEAKDLQELQAEVKKLEGTGDSGGESSPDGDEKDIREEILSKRREIAKKIRSKLRNCRCLIFILSGQALQSKWMPWELGFFDGRWGKPAIGVYVRDDRNAPPDPEFQTLYTPVNDHNLKQFLYENTSLVTLLNRTDVDYDRVMTLLVGMVRNPLAFSLGFAQYLLEFWREIAGRLDLPGLGPVPASWLAPMDSYLHMLWSLQLNLLPPVLPLAGHSAAEGCSWWPPIRAALWIQEISQAIFERHEQHREQRELGEWRRAFASDFHTGRG